MGRRIADLLIKIGADSYEFQQKTRQVEKGLEGVSKKLTNVGKNLTMKLTAPLAALGGVSVALADTQAKAEAKVQQAIKSTSGAAKLSFDQLAAFASELQGKTLFGDETILNNATAQLLTFTNISGENFKRTQAVALDLSTVLDGDLKSASIQLGKALNDPVKNLSALSRSRLQFSKEQTNVIKSLAETGRLAEAQSIILDELERKYGGQAEARAKVGASALFQLKNSWGDFMEQIGAIILSGLNKVVGVLQSVVTWLQSLSPTTKTIIVTIGGLAASIGPLLLTLGGIVKILPILKAGMLALNSPITGLIGLAAGLALAFKMAFDSYQDLQNLDKSTAQQWVADGTFKVGDEDKVKALIAQEEAKYKQIDDYYTEKLGDFWKDWNGDYRSELESSALLANTYREVLVELEKKKKSEDAALASAKKISDEAKNFATQVTNGIQPLEEVTEKVGNIVNPILLLKQQISELEGKKLLPETTANEIAVINSELSKLNAQLKEVQDSVVTRGENPATPVSGLTEGNLITTEVVTADMPIEIKPRPILPKSEEIKKTLENLMSTVKNSIANVITSSMESLGNIIVNPELGLESLGKAILMQMANFLTIIGEQLVVFGATMLTFQLALESALAAPWVAIGIGAAMVLAGSIMSAAIQKSAQDNAPRLANGGLAYGATFAMVGDNPNASVDPEVIAPLSKLKKIIGPQQSDGDYKQIKLEIEGQKFVAFFQKMNHRNNRING